MRKEFGQYFEKLRKKKKLSQKKIGDSIEATRQYIDNIEKAKGKTSPPTFDKLNIIADLICDSDEQRNKLLWLAFMGRIESHADYYNHFHSDFKLPKA